MSLSQYESKIVLNYFGGVEATPALPSVYLGLFQVAPTDADASSTEVGASGSYSRVQIAGAIAANASFGSSSAVVTMSVNNPGWVVQGMNVYDATNSTLIGTVSTWATNSTTLTLYANMLHASSGAADSLVFSAFQPAAVNAAGGGSAVNSSAVITFAKATASWGTIVAAGLFDASTSGNLLAWDWLGNDPWVPFSATSASPSIVTAIGITANSTSFANGSSVVVTARFGGYLPSGFTAETVGTVASLSSDTFSLGSNTTTTGSGMVRQVVSQSVPNNVTASFAAASLTILAA